MHVLRNKDGQLFSKLGNLYHDYNPVWIYPGERGLVAVYPKATWPEVLSNIKCNFGIELEGEIVKVTLPEDHGQSPWSPQPGDTRGFAPEETQR